jgi:hypothetical protein
MEGLRFRPAQGNAGDPDVAILSDEELREAEDEGKKRSQ